MGVCPSAWLNPDPHPKMIQQSILPSPVLPGRLPNQWCAHAHDRYGGNIKTPSQSCWHFFVNIPYHSWWALHMYIKRSDIMMVRRRKMLGKIIGQIFMPWWPYYMVCVQIYLIDQQKNWPFIYRERWRFIVMLQIPLAVLLSTKIVVGPCFQPISSRVRRNTFPFYSL